MPKMAGKEVIMITETARAKINLTLWVGRKRPDGYHSIDSVMHSISLSDEITLEKSNEILLTVLEGDAPAGQENLMVRAAEAFFAVTELEGGVFLTLKKRIPSGAGMGGGSADAAAVLRGLSKAYEHPLSKEDLLKVAARIGADVPFCVEGGASRCQGIGEILTPARAWEGLPLVIAMPPLFMPTGPAYQKLDERKELSIDKTEDCLKALEERDWEGLADSLSNDFELGLFPNSPGTPLGRPLCPELRLPRRHDRLRLRFLPHPRKPRRRTVDRRTDPRRKTRLVRPDSRNRRKT